MIPCGLRQPLVIFMVCPKNYRQLTTAFSLLSVHAEYRCTTYFTYCPFVRQPVNRFRFNKTWS